MAESNADVYASFGVNSAVVTGGSQEEHTQNMLALDVATRDGDDLISITEDEPVDLYANSDKFANPEDDNGFIQVRIGDGSDPEEVTTGQPEVTPTDDAEFQQLGEIPENLTDTSQKLADHEAGFQTIVEQAKEKGMPEDSISRIQSEYQGDGISEQSYAELEAAGYSRQFVDSYISGQEALVESYVNQVMDFAGGREAFQAVHAHMVATNPEAAQTFETALGNRDMVTMKALLNLAGQSRTKAYGKPAERSMLSKGAPAAPAKPEGKAKVEPFANQQELIKAMSDDRYRNDAAYRRSVELRVIHSSF